MIKYWAVEGDIIDKETFEYFANNVLWNIECWALENWKSLYQIKKLEYKGAIKERRIM